MKKYDVGFDYDGCISSFQRGVEQQLRNKGFKDLKCDPLKYHFHRDWGWSDEEFQEFWKQGVRDGVIFAAKPYPGAVEAVNDIYDAGHRVHIITHRGWEDEPGLAEDLTAATLERDGFRYHSLTFTDHKPDVKTDFMVDDLPKNYDALVAAGTEAYLLTRPWNEGLEGYRRVRSVREFSRRVLSISE
jgi:hypothetical protein